MARDYTSDTVTVISGDKGKGRSFQGVLLGYITAPQVVTGGSWGEHRPIWGLFAASPGEAKPFGANLRLGRKAGVGNGSKTMQFMAKLGYRLDMQTSEHGAVLCLYLPELFTVDPGMVNPDGVLFCLLVERAGALAASWDRAAVQAHLQRLGRALDEDRLLLVPYFASYLNRYSRLPLPRDMRFYAQLLAVLAREGGAGWPGYGTGASEIQSEGLDSLGILPPLLVNAKHEPLADVCAVEVERFVRAGGSLL